MLQRTLSKTMMKVVTLTLLSIFTITIFVSAQTSDLQTKRWTVDNLTREAMVYIPASAKGKPTPVVFVFHGHGGNMNEMFKGHHFEKLWPEAIVIAPQGLKTPGQLVDREGNYSGWQQSPGDQADRDLKFFDAMLASLRGQYHIDDKRIYATGHSNGGSFCYLLWAMRGDVLAAVAPSAGVGLRFADRLKPKPVLHIMSDNDALVKPAWQQMMIDKLLQLNDCGHEGKVFDQNAIIYPSPKGNPVLVYVHPGGHIYPNEAEATVVRFFKLYPKK